LKRLVVLLCATSACTPSFEPVQIVRDLRVIAMVADHPEIVGKPDPMTVIPPVKVDVIWADPTDPSPHAWAMLACAPASRGSPFNGEGVTTLGNRCEDDVLAVPIAHGMARPGEVISGSFRADLALLKHAADVDPLHGFDGVTIQVEVRIGPRPPGGPPAPDDPTTIVAQKRIQYSLPIPADRVPNQNPAFESLSADGTVLPEGAPLMVAAGQKVKLLPKPTLGSDEHYKVLTFTNDLRELHEALTYSFFADGGALSQAETGGGKRVEVGKDPEPPDLSSDFTAPRMPGRVHLWFVIRDERGGADVIQRDIQVAP
jgi:hypothetical protein